MYFHATVHYRWRINAESSAPRPLAPDDLARHLLTAELEGVAGKYRLLHRDAARDAMNAELCQELWDAEQRIGVEASVHLRITKEDKQLAQQRAEEEAVLRSAHARQTVELELLLDRLTDQILGPVWWVSRYAELQFATGDPEKKVESFLRAFAVLQKTLHAASIDQISDEKLLVRRKIEEVFSVIEDKESLDLALQVMNRTLEHLGIHEVGDGTAGFNGSGYNFTQGTRAEF
ncbi:hypothetical protein I6J42_19500 [Streptomyces californicus]|uniref:Uncharacterized protein n=1 Tax=Streptomyces californicus TaxID=67351 RepID=A0ABD7CXI7_9ACTN|nr:hypothetical protein [Streptomyces californicus]QRV35994.1 hypothetical protein I6J42_19500 [Streptomyces californicus]QRV48497.1 hypothetical protein I6J43_14130 [Streptomyces californicus]